MLYTIANDDLYLTVTCKQEWWTTIWHPTTTASFQMEWGKYFEINERRKSWIELTAWVLFHLRHSQMSLNRLPHLLATRKSYVMEANQVKCATKRNLQCRYSIEVSVIHAPNALECHCLLGCDWMNGMKSHGCPLKSSRSDVGANPLNQRAKKR